MEDKELAKAKDFAVGEDLDAISVDELKARINVLEAEITRLKQAIEAKQGQRQAADALFS